MTRTTKSIRFSEDHQDLVKLLSAFEGMSEGELIEHAIEAYVQARVLTYRKSLGLSREDVAVEAAPELVARLRGAVEDAIVRGVRAKSEDEIKADLREAAARRREHALSGASVPA